jgi:Response regulator containing a CheY-like receiver domain and an HTH DNA-binding domain
MNATQPGDKDALQQKIDEQIAHIEAIEENFPGVLIIHRIENLSSTVVFMSKWGRDYLGITNEELRNMGTEFHQQFFNAEDAKDYVPKLVALIERNEVDMVSYFQQVRRSVHHDWGWFLTASRIFFRDDQGKPALALTTSIPVDAQHHIAAKAQRLLEENNFLRRNYHIFDQLTKREKEILRMTALGVSSEEMAASLHISETTVSTHRRNVKRKLKITSHYDIIRFAQAFDLI